MNFNCPSRRSTHGIIIGYNKIPVDQAVLQTLKGYNYDTDYVRNCIEANRHNSVTTTYHLALKKFIKDGGESPCDFTSKQFDPMIL